MKCETWNYFGLELKDISHTPVRIPGDGVTSLLARYRVTPGNFLMLAAPAHEIYKVANQTETPKPYHYDE